MKTRFTKRSALNIASVSFALLAVIWIITLRSPIAFAVPAGAEHISAPVPLDTPEAPLANNFVSVSSMIRGYCFAKSQLKDTTAPGGFGPSNNIPQKAERINVANALFLIAHPNVVEPFGDSPGMRVTLVNYTKELLSFDAVDSRLGIVQQAQDADGAWRPVEYLPMSDCGNSYHRLFLAPNYFWAFAAPRYQGTMPTKLRFALKLADGATLYSNTFGGSVNPTQFTDQLSP